MPFAVRVVGMLFAVSILSLPMPVFISSFNLVDALATARSPCIRFFLFRFVAPQ